VFEAVDFAPIVYFSSNCYFLKDYLAEMAKNTVPANVLSMSIGIEFFEKCFSYLQDKAFITVGLLLFLVNNRVDFESFTFVFTSPNELCWSNDFSGFVLC
jgi:hypothetical protein